MKKELCGMYLCIGATAAHDGVFFFQNFTDGFFQHLLHADGFALTLPAAVVVAFIGDVEEKFHEGYC